MTPIANLLTFDSTKKMFLTYAISDTNMVYNLTLEVATSNSSVWAELNRETTA